MRDCNNQWDFRAVGCRISHKIDSNQRLGSAMPLITISRGIGCGGMIVARLVSESLKVELSDDNKLHQEADKMGIRAEEVKGLDEKAPLFFDSPSIWTGTIHPSMI
jgi:hypothetical protein